LPGKTPPESGTLLSRGNGEKSTPDTKKNEKISPLTYTDDEENGLLFQLSEELIDEDALKYDSWHEWQRAAEAEQIAGIGDGSDTVQGSMPEDATGWETEIWYEETWHRARERKREKAAEGGERITMSEAKRRLTARLKDDSELDRFLEAMGAVLRDKYNETPADAEEAAGMPNRNNNHYSLTQADFRGGCVRG
jgi:hypothetical protein